jgi:hypothetical protein
MRFAGIDLLEELTIDAATAIATVVIYWLRGIYCFELVELTLGRVDCSLLTSLFFLLSSDH